MKKNDLVKFAIVGLVAGFCISGQSPFKEGAEVRVTKELSDVAQSMKENPPAASKEKDSKSEEGKSAAKKVMEGNDSVTSSNGVRKSAAQRAMEAEG